MLRPAWVLSILVLTAAACDGSLRPATPEADDPEVAGAPVVESPEAEPTPRPISAITVVGLWDDGLLGENTMLDLRADGSAHIVSMAVVRASWTFDAESRRVTITSRRQADGSKVEQHVAYAPGQDVLTGRFHGPSGREHVFRRASQEAIDWWAGVRPRVEAEEAGRQGGDGQPDPDGR